MTTVTQHIDQLTDELKTKGWVHLTDKSEEQLQTILNGIGQVIFTTDVVVKPDSKGMVTSERGLDFHTDHHKAKYILWYCYRQTDKGGNTFLIDADKVFQQLSANEQTELSNIKLFEHKIFPDDQENNPLVTLDNGQRKFYYSFWLVKQEDKQNKALKHFQDLLKSSDNVSLNLQPRDVLIVDNHRIFHGRTPIEGSKDRFLKRFWLTTN